MTLLWFVVWFVFDRIGDREPLTFDPVNVWAGTLLLVVALDLARQHTPERSRRKAPEEPRVTIGWSGWRLVCTRAALCDSSAG